MNIDRAEGEPSPPEFFGDDWHLLRQSQGWFIEDAIKAYSGAAIDMFLKASRACGIFENISAREFRYDRTVGVTCLHEATSYLAAVWRHRELPEQPEFPSMIDTERWVDQWLAWLRQTVLLWIHDYPDLIAATCDVILAERSGNWSLQGERLIDGLRKFYPLPRGPQGDLFLPVSDL